MENLKEMILRNQDNLTLEELNEISELTNSIKKSRKNAIKEKEKEEKETIRNNRNEIGKKICSEVGIGFEVSFIYKDSIGKATIKKLNDKTVSFEVTDDNTPTWRYYYQICSEDEIANIEE